MPTEFYFKKTAIIGVGLIGGSLAMILKSKGLTGHVTGVGRGLDNLIAAKRLGVVDDYTQDVQKGVADADLVVVAVPVLKIGDTVRNALPSLKPGAIVTDVGSVKKAIIDEVEPLMPKGVHFVPGHPIAGTEHSGVEAAFPELFIARRCILTPTRRTDPEALGLVKRVWEEAGSTVTVMDARLHDRILAAVSHLPHMIAYTLVNTVGDLEKTGSSDVISYSAGGFKDFTRIASSSPEMWSDICALNKDEIVSMIEGFEQRLAGLKKLINTGDLEALRDEFARAKGLRDSLTGR